ncbi:MAG: YHYH protein [Patescibacteria group bacterium]|nr:YHYH protein [Patescibacteria group bacterium]
MHKLAAIIFSFFAAISSLFGPSGSAAKPQASPSPTQAVAEMASSSAPAIPVSGASIAATSSAIVASSSPALGSEASSTDPLAGLGSDMYSDGILPLGDYRYVTKAPKKGYVYLCNTAQGGGGAQENGPWIGTSTWNIYQKIYVQGATSWPNATVHISVANGTRTIVSNGLPTVGTTGDFPISATDPASAYDRNPNSISAQNYDFNLPANPVFAAAPGCIFGEVGVMTNGVPLLDAFDAEYRDAAAHEIQDSCDGHPHENGVYHYHSLSACIPDATVTNIIGWAFDGFPITGPKIADHRYLTTADLDECHGIKSPIMMGGKLVDTYHYVMTLDFPYSVSCFRGRSYEPRPGANAGSGGTAHSPDGAAQGSATGAPGQNGGPPQAAVNACSNGSNGSMCSFSGPNGTISGICRTPPGQSTLACVPQ